MQATGRQFIAPAYLKKEGPAFDLPIAIAMAAVGRNQELEHVEQTMIVGELALDGTVRPAPAARVGLL